MIEIAQIGYVTAILICLVIVFKILKEMVRYERANKVQDRKKLRHIRPLNQAYDIKTYQINKGLINPQRNGKIKFNN